MVAVTCRRRVRAGGATMGLESGAATSPVAVRRLMMNPWQLAPRSPLRVAVSAKAAGVAAMGVKMFQMMRPGCWRMSGSVSKDCDKYSTATVAGISSVKSSSRPVDVTARAWLESLKSALTCWLRW